MERLDAGPGVQGKAHPAKAAGVAGQGRTSRHVGQDKTVALCYLLHVRKPLCTLGSPRGGLVSGGCQKLEQSLVWQL